MWFVESVSHSQTHDRIVLYSFTLDLLFDKVTVHIQKVCNLQCFMYTYLLWWVILDCYTSWQNLFLYFVHSSIPPFCLYFLRIPIYYFLLWRSYISISPQHNPLQFARNYSPVEYRFNVIFLSCSIDSGAPTWRSALNSTQNEVCIILYWTISGHFSKMLYTGWLIIMVVYCS